VRTRNKKKKNEAQKADWICGPKKEKYFRREGENSNRPLTGQGRRNNNGSS
jgi:hypothetical protein